MTEETYIQTLEEYNKILKESLIGYGHERPAWCTHKENCIHCYTQKYINGEYCWGITLKPEELPAPSCDVIVHCTNIDDDDRIGRSYMTPIESLELIRGFSNALRGYMKKTGWGDAPK
jgi:hypothetical protein